MKSIKKIKQNFIKSLASDNPIKEVLAIWNFWVLNEFLKTTLIESYMNEDLLLDNNQIKKINSLKNHLLKRLPVQYFFGYSYFKDYKIIVNKSVLIPRPETEQLVDIIINDFKLYKPKKMIDIGTGSGCISIALKKVLSLDVVAVDNSEKALKTAIQNAKNHNTAIRFKFFDILIQENNNFDFFDIIVSNPPYVCYSEIESDSNIHLVFSHLSCFHFFHF